MQQQRKEYFQQIGPLQMKIRTQLWRMFHPTVDSRHHRRHRHYTLRYYPKQSTIYTIELLFLIISLLTTAGTTTKTTTTMIATSIAPIRQPFAQQQQQPRRSSASADHMMMTMIMGATPAQLRPLPVPIAVATKRAVRRGVKWTTTIPSSSLINNKLTSTVRMTAAVGGSSTIRRSSARIRLRHTSAHTRRRGVATQEGSTVKVDATNGLSIRSSATSSNAIHFDAHRRTKSVVATSSANVEILLEAERANGACTLNCTRYYSFICIAPTLFSRQLLNLLRLSTISTFSVCRNDDALKSQPILYDSSSALRRWHWWPPTTIGIMVVECEDYYEEDWSWLAEIKRASWSSPTCTLRMMLLLVVHNARVVPAIAVDPQLRAFIGATVDRAKQLSGVYNLENIELLLEELFDVMDRMNGISSSDAGTSSDKLNSGHSPGDGGDQNDVNGVQLNGLINGYREHVPDWAFVVIIVSIILSALAFYIGTCINKRGATLRSFNGGNPKKSSNRRSWGAGFSGGIWAAA